MHLGQLGFTCSTCKTFAETKNTKIKQIGNSQCIYQNKLDKNWFEHGMAYRII